MTTWSNFIWMIFYKIKVLKIKLHVIQSSRSDKISDILYENMELSWVLEERLKKKSYQIQNKFLKIGNFTINIYMEDECFKSLWTNWSVGNHNPRILD